MFFAKKWLQDMHLFEYFLPFSLLEHDKTEQRALFLSELTFKICFVSVNPIFSSASRYLLWMCAKLELNSSSYLTATCGNISWTARDSRRRLRFLHFINIRKFVCWLQFELVQYICIVGGNVKQVHATIQCPSFRLPFACIALY